MSKNLPSVPGDSSIVIFHSTVPSTILNMSSSNRWMQGHSWPEAGWRPSHNHSDLRGFQKSIEKVLKQWLPTPSPYCGCLMLGEHKLMSLMYKNKSFWRPVFPDKHLHWYWHGWHLNSKEQICTKI